MGRNFEGKLREAFKSDNTGRKLRTEVMEFLDGKGTPRWKDGNKLGLRKRLMLTNV